MRKKKEGLKFNFVVGHYWEKDKQIGCYTYFSTNHYGTMEDANDYLEYVKGKSPEHDWKIFMLNEVPV